MSEQKVAVTYEDGKVYQHFGHTEVFKIYHVEENKIGKTAVVSTKGYSHGSLALFLHEMGVTDLICGGIGGGAVNAVKDQGIHLYGGVEGDADQCVEDFLSGKLAFNDHANCSHHEHDHNHRCGGDNYEHNQQVNNKDHDCLGHNEKI